MQSANSQPLNSNRMDGFILLRTQKTTSEPSSAIPGSNLRVSLNNKATIGPRTFHSCSPVCNQGGRTSRSLPTSHTNPYLSFHRSPWRAQYTRMKERKGSARLPQKKKKACLIASRKKQMFSRRLVKPKQARRWDFGKERGTEGRCPDEASLTTPPPPPPIAS